MITPAEHQRLLRLASADEPVDFDQPGLGGRHIGFEGLPLVVVQYREAACGGR